MLKRKDKIERSGLIGVESVLYAEYGEVESHGSVVCIWHHDDDIILLVAPGTTVHKMLLSTHESCYVDIGEHSSFARLFSPMLSQSTADTLEWRMLVLFISENLNPSRHLHFWTQHYAFLLHAAWGDIIPLAIVSFDVISTRMQITASDKVLCDDGVPSGVRTSWNHKYGALYKMMEDGKDSVSSGSYARLHTASVLFDALIDPDPCASLAFTCFPRLGHHTLLGSFGPNNVLCAMDHTSSSIDCCILRRLVDNARAYALFGSTNGTSSHLTRCLVDTHLGILNLHGELLCGNTGTFVLCCGRSIDGFIPLHRADTDCLVLTRNHGDLVSFDCYLMCDVRQNAEHLAGIIPWFGISHNQLSTNIDSNCHRILILWSRTTSLHDIYHHRRFNACTHRSTPLCTIVSFENGETLPAYHRFCHTVWTLEDASCVSCVSCALNDIMSSTSELHQADFLKRMISSVEHSVDCYMILCLINGTTSSIIDNNAPSVNSATSSGRVIHLLGTSSNVQVLILREYFMRAIDWNKLISFLYGEWNTTTPQPDRVFLFIGDCSCVSCTSGTLIISMPLMNYTRRISYWIRNDYTTSTCVLLGDCYNGLCSSKSATSLFANNGADMVELNMVDNGEPIICPSLCCLRLLMVRFASISVRTTLLVMRHILPSKEQPICHVFTCNIARSTLDACLRHVLPNRMTIWRVFDLISDVLSDPRSF
eukprot:scaffold35960_cov294-Skeletonema_dohrnii-CCMP3373.AAC.1